MTLTIALLQYSNAMEKTEHQKLQKYRLFPSVRLFMILLNCFGVLVVAMGWSSMSFAMICMVNVTSTDQLLDQGLNSSSSLPAECRQRVIQAEVNTAGQGTFNWDKATQANILAAYSWGALVFLLPGGVLIDRYVLRAQHSLLHPFFLVTFYGNLPSLLKIFRVSLAALMTVIFPSTSLLHLACCTRISLPSSF